MLLEISLENGFLFDLPAIAYANGVRFTLAGFAGRQYYFKGPDQMSCKFIDFPRTLDQVPFLPDKLLVSTRPFVRRCETFFTPAQPSPAEIECFFDYVATYYEERIDLALNHEVLRRMFDAAFHYGAMRGLRELRVLDFGCGTGLSWSVLQSFRTTPLPVLLYGCDLSAGMVHASRECGFLRTEKTSYAETYFPDAFFDVILCSFVAHYFLDCRPFQELKRILRPNGMILFSLPARGPFERACFRSILQCGSRQSAEKTDLFYWPVSTSRTRIIPVITYKRGTDTSPCQNVSHPVMAKGQTMLWAASLGRA